MKGEMVLIENTQARVFHLPGDAKKLNDEHGHLKSVVVAAGKQLLPSYKNKEGEFVTDDGKGTTLNSVKKSVWDRKKNHPCVKTWMKLGYIKLHDSTAPGAEMPDTLNKYNNHTAIALAEGEDDIATLKQWAETEMREDVAAALSARLGSLEKKKG